MTDFHRYIRQTAITNIGIDGQNKLNKTKVLVVGAGGLGCPMLQYLASSGIGYITIVDGDQIELTNLHRQILYTEQDIGEYKAIIAAIRLQQNNHTVNIQPIPQKLDTKLAENLIPNHDIIADGTDSFLAKYIISDICAKYNKPYISASALQMQGYIGGYSANFPHFHNVFPETPYNALNCNDSGILPSVVGIIGMLQAHEIIKYNLNIPSIMGKMIRFNGIKSQFSEFSFKKIKAELSQIPTISYTNKKLNECRFLDVRQEKEFGEFKPFNNSIHIPLNELEKRKNEIPIHKPLLIICRLGRRSEQAAVILKDIGLKEIFILQGGLIDYYMS